MSPYAVCGLFVSSDGKVLSVSRKDNPNDLGLPGGKIDEGETPEEALEREVLEETGLVVESYDELVTLTCCGKPVTTYVIFDFSGEIKTEESGKVAWVDWEDIMSDQCSFKQYNECVQAVYDIEQSYIKIIHDYEDLCDSYYNKVINDNVYLENKVKVWKNLCNYWENQIKVLETRIKSWNGHSEYYIKELNKLRFVLAGSIYFSLICILVLIMFVLRI